MRSERLLLCVLILVCSFPLNLSADIISVRADPWCPYNCNPDDEYPGILIEIAKAVFAKAGHEVDYQILNWARAKREVQAGLINGIVGMTKDEETIPLYVFGENEQAISQMCYFILAGNDWTFESVSSLETQVLGVINGYGYYAELDEYIEANSDTTRVEAVAGDDPLVPNIKKLLRKRVTVLIEDRLVMEFTLKELGVSDQVKNAGCVDFLDNVHIAFSKELPKSEEYAKMLSDGVAALRASGELQTILDHYGVKDWR